MNSEEITELNKNARLFRLAEISLIEVSRNGSKIPVRSWKEYQKRLPTFEEIDSWFSKPAGVGMVCGVVSGGLEVLDFDEEPDKTFAAFQKLVDHILIKLPIVETPSGGYHIYYRCDEVTKNMRLAMPKPLGKSSDEKSRPLIETRGEGGLVMSVLNDEFVHKTGGLYIQVAGPVLPEIPVITPQERGELWRAARSLDRGGLVEAEINKRVVKEVRRRQPIVFHDSTDTPWGQLNRIAPAQWGTLLEMANWSSRDGVHWRHPNASSQCSAKLNSNQSGTGDFVLSVFSTSVSLQSDKSHSAYEFLKAEVLGGASDSAVVKAIKEMNL
ncbi:bifunctional DNA primase/polymerase [bacterium]|nr:bifunctional DNA primase/polymerase [bacterium]MDC0265497.1 bifunctional DNA primase/polymerase [Mariniblastus sp.]